MKKFIYKGSSILRFDVDKVEFCLVPNSEHELPSDHEFIKSLVAQKKLEPVQVFTPPPPIPDEVKAPVIEKKKAESKNESSTDNKTIS